MTVTRGMGGGGWLGKEEEGSPRNMYKGPVNKTQGGSDGGWELGMGGGRGEWWEENEDNCT